MSVGRSTARNPFLALQLEVAPRLHEQAYQCVAEAQALDIGLAVLQYRARYGALPERLSVLRDANLVERLPVDPFADRGYGYRVTVTGFKIHGGRSETPLFGWRRPDTMSAESER